MKVEAILNDVVLYSKRLLKVVSNKQKGEPFVFKTWEQIEGAYCDLMNDYRDDLRVHMREQLNRNEPQKVFYLLMLEAMTTEMLLITGGKGQWTMDTLSERAENILLVAYNLFSAFIGLKHFKHAKDFPLSKDEMSMALPKYMEAQSSPVVANVQ